VPGMPVTEQPVRSAFDDRSSRAASPRLSSNCICCGMPGSVIGVMSVRHVHRTAPVPLLWTTTSHTCDRPKGPSEPSHHRICRLVAGVGTRPARLHRSRTESSLTSRSMRSTRPPSIFVWRSFRGPISAPPKRRSRCTRCWTCAATSEIHPRCRMASCTTFTRSRFVEPGNRHQRRRPRLRQTTIERFVKAHRLRRWQAPRGSEHPKTEAVARSHPGWSRRRADHIRTLTVRIRLVNQQLKAAHRKVGRALRSAHPIRGERAGSSNASKARCGDPAIHARAR